jgi:aminoglycoside/choline kinase family phosphotransferase
MERLHPTTREAWRRREELAGDASSRRYSRLEADDGATLIIAEYPPGEARRALQRDVEVLRWCADRGLRVPAILDQNILDGWLLLEDLGRDDAERRLRDADPLRRPEMVEHSITPLEILAAIDPHELPRWNRPLDTHRLRWELAGFELWYVRHVRGQRPPASIGEWLDGLAAELSGHPRRVCHRDYHLNNLFFEASGGVAVIDVQDILVGPDTYDAVSMVAERSGLELLDEATRLGWLESWAERTAAAPGWRDRWPRVRLQRGLKVLGTFARLTAAGRPTYREWLDVLARRMVADADELGIPGFLTELLVD